jgi:hypothetical protein
MTRGTILLFAFCCGAIVANIYWVQTVWLRAWHVHAASGN